MVNDRRSLKQFFHGDRNIDTHPPSTIDNDLGALDFRPNKAGRRGTNTFDLYFFRRFIKSLSSAMLEIVDFVEIDGRCRRGAHGGKRWKVVVKRGEKK
jgi:hypothetical protein